MNLRVAVGIAMATVLSVAPAQPSFTIVVLKNTAVLAADQQFLSLDLKPFSAAAVITRAKLLSTAVRDGISYVVVEVSGPTVRNGESGYCGAGEESNLI